ncbi:very short patch repair endonuclease [Kitasatospora sp. NPDC056181]|uniref:very short patch repair endonuclease n=1 Tax=Kitasatospora sp. NPDC056181 TaxID=3345737 RepID=UPI0035E0E832
MAKAGTAEPGAAPAKAPDRAERAREQDRAAGGADARLVDVGDGRLKRASVVLATSTRTGTVRARLSWSVDRHVRSVPLGVVDRRTRNANLREGWRLAREAGLLAQAPAGAAASWASSAGTRRSMRANKGKDTRPELRLRSLVHAAGLRYRVSARPLAGLRRTADLVFPGVKVAVFVDGCFWHCCPEHGTTPASHQKFWSDKLNRTRERDIETNRALKEAGWTVIRIWEHTEPEVAAETVVATVGAARGRTSATAR